MPKPEIILRRNIERILKSYLKNIGKNLFKLNTNIAAPLPSAGTLRKTPMRRRSISKFAETDSLGFKSGS